MVLIYLIEHGAPVSAAVMVYLAGRPTIWRLRNHLMQCTISLIRQNSLLSVCHIPKVQET